MVTNTILTESPLFTDAELWEIQAAFEGIAARIQLQFDTTPVTEPRPAPFIGAPPRHAPAPGLAEVEVNVELLQRALDGITDNPDTHTQSVWVQRNDHGTVTGCIAYHAIRLAGRTVNWKAWWWCRNESAYVTSTNRQGAEHMFGVARDALGLTDQQANLLFHPGNSLDDLWALAHKYSNGQVVRKEKVNA